MKIQFVLLYSTFLLAMRKSNHCLDDKPRRRRSFVNISNVYDRFNKRRSIDNCLPYNGDCINRHEQLIPFAALDSRNGFFTRKNLLACNFHLLERILKSISKHLNNNHIQFSLITDSADCCGDVAGIFRRCLYYVDFCDHCFYKKSLEDCRYDQCFYIIYNNLKCDTKVDDYILLLLDSKRSHEMRPNMFFNCADKCIVDTELSVCSTSNICLADFLLDPVSILELNLYERFQILEVIFKIYHRQHYLDIGHRRVKFMELYKKIYTRGTPLDHRVTAFVLYKIISDLRFRKFNASQIKSMVRFLCKYFEESLHSEAEFFCFLTFGVLKK